MNIQILKDLKDYNPVDLFPNKPLSLEEINSLETNYNNGNQFPIALRELLYLAGKYCYLLTYNSKSQPGIQSCALKMLQEEGLSINRPYYVIDLGADDFSYIYLDEDQVDPILYCGYMGDSDDRGNFFSLNKTLSQYINSALISVKKGYTPF